MTWTRSLLNILWPNRCPGCDAILTPEEYVCPECEERMILEHDAYCHICGKPVCVCKKRCFAYDRALAVCSYRDEAARAIVKMKRSCNTNFAYFSARILAERIRYSLNFGIPDCVMPVPMHPAKERSRGYNQAALIAQEAAHLLDVSYREDVLYKDKSRYAQHELGALERLQNVGSFGIRDISVEGMCILLCDDVLTTGATMNRCAALLKQNGAATVIAAAATTTVPENWHKPENKK